MWVKAKEREKNKEKHVNGAMFLTEGRGLPRKGGEKTGRK
jgi:hypothetical protein